MAVARNPSASYSLTMRLEIPSEAGSFALVAGAVAKAEGDMGAIDLVRVSKDYTVRDITVSASDSEHGQRIIDEVRAVPGVTLVNVSDRTFLMHLGGKIEVSNKVPIKTRDDLSMAYTPGVARVCMAIAADVEKARTLTIKQNTVAVVTDGTAVLGLGDIGPEAAMPVMEGKAMLFKEFAAPRCFEIEGRLRQELDIPVFHDDQHGTAVVVLAGLLNSAKLVQKRMDELKVVLVGVGAAGVAVSKLLLRAGVTDIIGCDREGSLYTGKKGLVGIKKWYAKHTNPRCFDGSAEEALRGADVFLGLSGPGAVSADAIRTMAGDAIVFAMANPDPEVPPEEIQGDVRVIATGRSDYPNQINNVLCFPGMFRGALNAHATTINEEMNMAAARAIASVISEDELGEEYVIPSVFNKAVVEHVAEAVAEAALATGVARKDATHSHDVTEIYR